MKKASEKKNVKKQRKWKKEEIETVLNYMIETIQKGFTIEKPTALTYYKRLIEKCTLPSEICSQLLRDKASYLRKQYKEAAVWSSQTGQGVKENEGEQSFKVKLLKRCPYYDLCNIIWGTKVNIHVPYSSSSSQIGQAESSKLPDIDQNSNNSDDLSNFQENVSVNECAPANTQDIIDYESTNTSEQSQSSLESVQSGVEVHGKTRKRLGETLSMVGRGKKTAKDAFEELVTMREKNASDKLQVLQASAELEKEKFLYEKERENKKMKLDKQLTIRKLKTDMAIQQMKLEAEKEATKRQLLQIRELELKLLLSGQRLPSSQMSSDLME